MCHNAHAGLCCKASPPAQATHPLVLIPSLRRCCTAALHLILCTSCLPQVLRVQGRALPKASQVHDKQSRDVVGLAPQVLLPEALLPEPETLHVLIVVAEGSEPKGSTLQPDWIAWVSTCMLLEVVGAATRLLSRSCQHNGVSSQCNAATVGAGPQPLARKCSAQADGGSATSELCPPLGAEH